jgi:hypothetical protein
MVYNSILGRDFISCPNIKISFGEEVQVEVSRLSTSVNELLNIDLVCKNNLIDDIIVSPSVSDSEAEKVKQVFQEHYVMGKIKPHVPKVDYEMKICLRHEQPFYFSPRRLSYNEKAEVKKIIDENLSKGIIRPNNSPYSSPIVLVRKKDGSHRICVDFRELNKLMIKDHYPMPLIDDCLDRLQEKRYFTCLDLKNGFHHVKMEENSIKYTSFVTLMGQYEYLRMPFGLCNSPAVSQQYVDSLFKPLVDANKVISYMNDIMIATWSIDDNPDVLGEVLNVLRANGLQLRIDKCKFLQASALYLGYVVDECGIRPDPKNRSGYSVSAPKEREGCPKFFGSYIVFQ